MEGSAPQDREDTGWSLSRFAQRWSNPARGGSTLLSAIGIAIALALTLLAWNISYEREFERNQQAFTALSLDSEQALFHRLRTYRTALDGAAALFIARDGVTFPEWEDYVATIDLDRSLNGLDGIGFIRPVMNEEVEEFIAHAQARGAPLEEVHPVSERSELLPIKYISPVSANYRAMGLDLAFEDNRRNALIASRESGEMTITGPITLVQDDAQGIGFLLVRPIYRNGARDETVSERLSAFEGWSYAPLRARAFLSGLTSRQGLAYELNIYQGSTRDPANLIYSSETDETAAHIARFTRMATVEIAGQNWTLEWRSLPEFEQSAESNEPLVVLLCGIAISLCLGALLLMGARREGQIRRKVAEATHELAERDRERDVILEDLREARDDSLAAVKAKSTFLANMSHELRTPMNGVLGFADLLVRSDLPPQARKQAELIAESGRVMGRLLDDILDLSRIEAGKMVIAQETLDPKHVCQHVMRLVEPAARDKGLELDFRLGKEIPHLIVGDKLRLQQVLINLVGNAVKFTDRGYVCIDLMRDKGSLRFEVRDSGIGIAKSKLASIFEDFVQADQGTAKLRGGSGLGLAISSKLARAMGGELQVDSQEGIGSTFTLTLPLTVAAAQPVTDLAADSDRPAPQMFEREEARLLLAEDHEINRLLVEAMAREAGVMLDVASDGKEAVAMAEHAAMNGMPYHLVLMDVQMPGMDGMEATRALRDKGLTDDALPIVALTANAFAEDVQACLDSGMQAHCAKPLTMERFLQVLNKWIPDPGGGTRQAA